MEKRAIKFPIASVFALLLALTEIYNLVFFLYRMYYWNGDLPSNFQFYAYNILLIAFKLMLAILLFMRKRSTLLCAVLIINGIYPLYDLLVFAANARQIGFYEQFHPVIHNAQLWFIGICGMYVLEGLLFFLLSVQARLPIPPENAERKRLLQTIWYLPGIISILVIFAKFIDSLESFRSYSGIYLLLNLFLYVPMVFTLSWWLTHPYVEVRPVPFYGYYGYNAPPMAPYPYPYTAPKVFCSGCGRELPPDEDFCAMCGTARPGTYRNPPHNEHTGNTRHTDW